MRSQRWLPWLLALALVGCENRLRQEKTGEPSREVPVASTLPTDTSHQARLPLPPALPLDTEIAPTWRRLRTALRRHDAAQLNQFLDPKLGLWVLEDGDTGLTITRVAAGTAFQRAYARVPVPNLDRQACATLLAVTAFPEVDCGDRVSGRSGFARDGCFAGPATDFQALDIWPRARLRGGTAAQGRVAQARVARTVLHTGSGFRFHFAQAPGGRWHLVFVDLRPPCIS
ncbi:hypothetical protein [Hymenobacter convexus]|uniref:hypothetical protein n=1 Tax=Hymenobacter sp. CA1UV-4 TaxID=3063782 RepID=UPI0027127DE5|nr:hypothetical protein [Hymenobacter sp. CA1UV-4]MDO7852524.1 hypothetical protein [Hymenobacter sp. CA1UV-4]